MQHILVFGNEGSFFLQATRLLKQHYITHVCIIDRLDPYKSLDSFISSITIERGNIFAVIYLGGETRDFRSMQLMNYYFPKHLFEAFSQLLPSLRIFLYLSSLSVFSYPCTNPLSPNSDRHPEDLYGISKNRLDNYLRSQSVDFSIFAIAPGSIVNPLSRHGVLAKIKNFHGHFLFKPLLGLLAPPGAFHCVLRSDLYSCILQVLSDASSNKLTPGFTFSLFSASILYSDILRSLGFKSRYLLPVWLYWFFTLPILPHHIRKKSFLLFVPFSVDSCFPHLLSADADVYVGDP